MTLFGKKLSKEERRSKRVKLIIYRDWLRAARRVEFAKKDLKSNADALERWRLKEPEFTFLWELRIARSAAHLEQCEKELTGIRQHLSDADFEALDAVYGVSASKSNFKKMMIFMIVAILITAPIMKALGMDVVDDFWTIELVAFTVSVVDVYCFFPRLSKVKLAP